MKNTTVDTKTRELLEKFNYSDNLYRLVDFIIDWFIEVSRSKKLFFFMKKRYGNGYYKVKALGVSHDFFLEVDLTGNNEFFKEINRKSNDTDDIILDLETFDIGKYPLADILQKNSFEKILPFLSRNKLVGGIVFQSNGTIVLPEKEHLEKISILLENAYFQRNLIIEKWEKGVLLEVSKKLALSNNPNEALNIIIDSLKKFINYDAAAIFLVDHSANIIKYRVLRGYDKRAFQKKPIKIGEGLVGWSIKTGKDLIVHDVTKDPRYIGRRSTTLSEMVVPIVSQKKILGAFNLESDKYHFFTKNQLDTLKAFASQTAVTLENARLHKDSVEKKQIEKDLKIASEIQRVLLPRGQFPIENYKVSARNIASKKVGGDFFDLENIGDKHVGIAIGDISGKGISGAILMATLYANFKSQIRINNETHKVIKNLNNSFYDITEEDKYATFFYGILNYSTHEFFYSNAGHNSTILLKNDRTTELLNEGGPVLGFLRDINYKSGIKKLMKGDILFMYTDGVTECMNRYREEFGEKRLFDFLKKHSHMEPDEINSKLMDEIKKFSQKKFFKDDVTFIILKRI